MEFFQDLKEKVEKFKEIKTEPIRIIGHLDSDGISATSILIKAFKREGYKFCVSIVRQLDETVLKELSLEDYETYVFCDIGSGYIKDIEKNLKGKNIVILDHHKFDYDSKDIIHLNPLNNEIAINELSGAGVTYFFARELNEANKDIAHIAIVGAIGDMQEDKGLKGLNNKILTDAINSGNMEVKRGLNMFGMQSRPLHKVLEYSTEPYIPGVTGDEDGSLKFLDELGIKSSDENGKFRKLIELNEDEMKKLITGIIIKRMGSEENAEDVLGPIYLLTNEEDGSPTRDAKEFSTLLNACGRLNKYSIGIGTCLGDEEIKKEALALLQDYKKEIVYALNYFHENKENFIKGEGYVIIDAEENIRDNLIGTLSTIISKSNVFDEGTLIIGLADSLDGQTKISMRVSDDLDLDARELLLKTMSKLGDYTCGGHKKACGGLIPLEKKKEFIKIVREILDKTLVKSIAK